MRPRLWAVVGAVGLMVVGASGQAAGAQPETAPGGTGISFLVEQGKFTVAEILPGSPGDEADVPLGAILLEVDGEPVAGLSREQVGEMIRGSVGTRVRLTFEIEGERRVVRLRRADLSQIAPPETPGQPSPRPERGPRDGNAGDGEPSRGRQSRPERSNPALADLSAMMGDVELVLGLTPEEAARYPAPEFARAGVRLMYESMGSISTNVFQRDGISIPQWETPTGHVSIAALDIAGVEGGAALAVRTDFLVDPTTRSITGVTPAFTSAGPASAMQDYWVHPDILATAEDRVAGRDGRVFRGPYELDGRTYEVVRIRVQSRESVSHWMFDARTGLLLVARSGNLAGRYNTSRNNDPRRDDWEEVSSNQLRFLGMREIDWPGLAGRLPEWVQRGRSMTFQGGDYIVVNGEAASAGERATRYQITHAGRTMLLGTLRALSGNATGEAAQIGGGVGCPMVTFALPAGAWDDMRPGQVIDRDRVTGVEIVVTDKTGEFVTIEQRHQAFRQRRVFDREGRLVQAEDFTSAPTGGQGWLFNLVGFE